MVRGWIMFGEVIPEVHVYWIPFDLKVILFHLIIYQIKGYVHGFSNFLFDGSSHDSICG